MCVSLRRSKCAGELTCGGGGSVDGGVLQQQLESTLAAQQEYATRRIVIRYRRPQPAFIVIVVAFTHRLSLAFAHARFRPLPCIAPSPRRLLRRLIRTPFAFSSTAPPPPPPPLLQRRGPHLAYHHTNARRVIPAGVSYGRVVFVLCCAVVESWTPPGIGIPAGNGQGKVEK